MVMRQKLYVGDTVYWRGGFGLWPERPAAVTKIVYIRNGRKYGLSLPSVEWTYVAKRVIVELDNGHWAYGDHIRRMPRGT